jgi:cysteine synthase A
MIETARRVSEQPGHWYCDQLSNDDGTRGYLQLGEEIWKQTRGKVDAFVQAVGTAHSIHGVTESLWKHNKSVRIIAVEPTESAVLSGSPTGTHKIEGIGIGYVPPLWNPKLVNEIITVSTDEAKSMARRLAKEEAFVRRDLVRSQRGSLVEGRRAARPQRERCNGDGRFGFEVS